MSTDYYIKLGHECAARGWFFWEPGMLARSATTGPKGGFRKCRVIGEMSDGTPKTNSGKYVMPVHMCLGCELELVLPDLTDAATVGCLLDLARRNIGRKVSPVWSEDGLWHVPGFPQCFPSEAEALMAATDKAVPDAAAMATERLQLQAATKARLQTEKEERAALEKQQAALERERAHWYAINEPKRVAESIAWRKAEAEKAQAKRDKIAATNLARMSKVSDRWPAMSNEELVKEHLNLTLAQAKLIEAHETTKVETSFYNKNRGKPGVKKPSPGLQTMSHHVRDANALLVAMRQEMKRRGMV